MTLKILTASPANIAALAVCGREFDTEGGVYTRTPLIDQELYQDLADYIASPNHVVALAEVDGVPAGFCVFGVGKVTGRREYEALMTWFYVRKSHRSGHLATELLDYSMKLCKDKGAKYFFASSTAGFDDGGLNERAFTALLRRNGFSVLGSILMFREP